jgi:hypothetical protein
MTIIKNIKLEKEITFTKNIRLEERDDHHQGKYIRRVR